MAENEELVLTVRVDDQASAYINNLKAQLGSLGTGAQAAGAERFRRQSRESGEGIAQLSHQMRGFAVTAGVIGGVVGAVATKITELGASFIARISDVKGYATAIDQLQKASYTAGTSTAQMKANIDVFRESGIGADEAGSQLQRYSETMADLGRVNSETRRALFRGLRPGEVSDMRAFVDDVLTSSGPEQLNKIKARGEEIRKYITSIAGPEAGAERQASFYKLFGLDALGQVRGRFREVTAEQQKLFDDRAKEAQRYLTLTEKQETAWQRLTASATAAAFELLPINATMQLILDKTEGVAAAALNWEIRLRNAQAIADKAAPQPGATGEKGDEWWRRFDPFDPRNVKREQAVAPELHPQPPPPPVPTTRQTTTQQQTERFRIREEEQAREAERQRKQEEADKRAAEGLPPLVTPAPPPPPPSAPVRTPYTRPSRLGVPPKPAEAAPEPAPPTEPQPAPTPTPPAAPDVVRTESERRRREAAQPAKSLLDSLFGGGAQAAPPAAVPQKFIQGELPAAATQRFVPDPEFLAGREAGVGTAGGGLEDRRQQTDQTRQLTDQMKLLTDAMRTPREAAPTGLASNLGLKDVGVPPPAIESPPQAMPIIVPQEQAPPMQPALPVPFVEAQKQIILPSQAPPMAFREPQPLPSAFTGGRPIDLAGTGDPNQAASEKGQTQNWLDAGAGFGAAYDRAAQQQVKVDGSGKLEVDFKNMPRGVTGKAQGEGLFRTTAINRQIQMEPASSGPVSEM